MSDHKIKISQSRGGNFLRTLAHDRSGNTLAMIAAAIFPLLGLVGGGIDIGRAYAAESRLQQACDAGVLAARKRLGSELPPSNAVVGQVAVVGNEFFNLNFPKGRYDVEKPNFQLTLEPDYSISGTASIVLPTAVMGVFGYDTIPIDVTCMSRMNFTNLDIMMVLDVTGSMRLTNPGDDASRIDSMRTVIKNFHSNIEIAKAPETRIRYGFLPYATNVNVGHLLEDDWVVDNWTYQSREYAGVRVSEYNTTYSNNWIYVSGSTSGWVTESSYPATFVPGNPPSEGSGDEEESSGSSGYYRCDGSQPSDTLTRNDVLISTTTEPFAGPPAGTKTTERFERTENGVDYTTSRSGSTCEIRSNVYDNYKQTYDRITHPKMSEQVEWTYKPVAYDVSDWRLSTAGCIEERASSQILDYSNVDLSINRDLDINSLPVSADDDTKWKPLFPDHVYARRMGLSGSGPLDPLESTTHFPYAQTGFYWMSDCPAQAQKLQEMDATALDTYLATLAPQGATYHDVGMIWGGRLLSQNGLFASENADESGNKPTTRHMIFLTDGQTEPYDIAYGPYGVEPLDQRRWDPSSTLTLAQTVEERFKFACNEARKNNTTIWVIAFGTTLNTAMTDCAGPGQYFEAKDADELQKAFADIAKSMGDLRISG